MGVTLGQETCTIIMVKKILVRNKYFELMMVCWVWFVMRCLQGQEVQNDLLLSPKFILLAFHVTQWKIKTK